MALVLADRVQETTTTTGTGTITLAGAVSGFQSFAVVGNGNTTYYAITSGTAWEVGVGTYSTTGPTLARTTILASSAGGAAITLAGTSNVFVTYPAGLAVVEDASGNVTLPGTLTVNGPSVISVNSTSDALRITQTNLTGNALVVEDSTNPDATPFIIDASGSLFIGDGTSYTMGNAPKVQLSSVSGGGSSINAITWSATGSPQYSFGRSRGTTTGSYTAVQAGDELGTISFYGSDGSALDRGAYITGVADGTPASTFVPARLAFFTGTSAANPAERMRIDSSGHVGIGVTAPTAALHLPAGAAAANSAPLKFTTGTVQTTAEAGTWEYDGEVFYATGEASQRGVVPNEQFVILTADYTTPAGTANTLKQAFNTTTNGAITVAGNSTYLFECMLKISTMSATSGNLQFGIGGTAVRTRTNYVAIANKTALGVQTASSHTFGTAATAVVITATNTTTTGYAFIQGSLVIGTGGTLIPSIALSVANACVVQAGSYFKLSPIGTNTVTQIGNWS
jgi:hypothetical protein